MTRRSLLQLLFAFVLHLHPVQSTSDPKQDAGRSLSDFAGADNSWLSTRCDEDDKECFEEPSSTTTTSTTTTTTTTTLFVPPPTETTTTTTTTSGDCQQGFDISKHYRLVTCNGRASSTHCPNSVWLQVDRNGDGVLNHDDGGWEITRPNTDAQGSCFNAQTDCPMCLDPAACLGNMFHVTGPANCTAMVGTFLTSIQYTYQDFFQTGQFAHDHNGYCPIYHWNNVITNVVQPTFDVQALTPDAFTSATDEKCQPWCQSRAYAADPCTIDACSQCPWCKATASCALCVGMTAENQRCHTDPGCLSCSSCLEPGNVEPPCYRLLMSDCKLYVVSDAPATRNVSFPLRDNEQCPPCISDQCNSIREVNPAYMSTFTRGPFFECPGDSPPTTPPSPLELTLSPPPKTTTPPSPPPAPNPCDTGCPGYTQLGKMCDDVPGCGLIGCIKVRSIEACCHLCTSNTDCGSYEYVEETQVCSLNPWNVSRTSAQTSCVPTQVTCSREPTCICGWPNQEYPRNDYSCIDGTHGQCIRSSCCTSTEPFRRGESGSACTPCRTTTTQNKIGEFEARTTTAFSMVTLPRMTTRTTTTTSSTIEITTTAIITTAITTTAITTTAITTATMTTTTLCECHPYERTEWRPIRQDYGEDNVFPRTEEATSEACRDRCQTTLRCQGATYYPDRGCELSGFDEGTAMYANVEGDAITTAWYCEPQCNAHTWTSFTVTYTSVTQTQTTTTTTSTSTVTTSTITTSTSTERSQYMTDRSTRHYQFVDIPASHDSRRTHIYCEDLPFSEFSAEEECTNINSPSDCEDFAVHQSQHGPSVAYHTRGAYPDAPAGTGCYVERDPSSGHFVGAYMQSRTGGSGLARENFRRVCKCTIHSESERSPMRSCVRTPNIQYSGTEIAITTQSAIDGNCEGACSTNENCAYTSKDPNSNCHFFQSGAHRSTNLALGEDSWECTLIRLLTSGLIHGNQPLANKLEQDYGRIEQASMKSPGFAWGAILVGSLVSSLFAVMLISQCSRRRVVPSDSAEAGHRSDQEGARPLMQTGYEA